MNFENKNDFVKSLETDGEYKLGEIKEKLKIELLWNKLIYIKYKNQVKINEASLIKKIEKFKDTERKEYLVSEIVFKKDKNMSLNEKIYKIKSSINEIGFNNTATIYSISDTSKFGGQVGWIDLNNFSEPVQNNLIGINEGEVTDIIQIGNNYIFIKVEKIKIEKLKINKEAELNKLINFETNTQLNRFSKIFFDKSKINYSINEK